MDQIIKDRARAQRHNGATASTSAKASVDKAGLRAQGAQHKVDLN